MTAVPIPVGAEPPPLNAGPPPRAVKTAPKRKRSGNRFAVINAFLDVTLRGLSRPELAVWLLLWRDVKSETGLARTGQASLAERAKCGVRTVRRAIKELEARGLLAVTRRGRLGTGPSTYQLFPLSRMGPKL